MFRYILDTQSEKNSKNSSLEEVPDDRERAHRLCGLLLSNNLTHIEYMYMPVTGVCEPDLF